MLFRIRDQVRDLGPGQRGRDAVAVAAAAGAPKRSASVLAQPSCMNGPRLPMPTSDGTWNAPPVPTSTVWLLVKPAPEWQEAQAPRVRVVEQRPAARDRVAIRGRAGAAAAAGRRSTSAACRSGRSPATGPTCGPRTRRVIRREMSVSSPLQWNGSVPRRPRVQRLRPARALAREVPDAAVVVALGVARRAGEVAARVRVEDEVAGVGAALVGQRDLAAAAAEREHGRLARLDDERARAVERDRDWLSDDLGDLGIRGCRTTRRSSPSSSRRRGSGREPVEPVAVVGTAGAGTVHAVRLAPDRGVGDAVRVGHEDARQAEAGAAARERCWSRCRPTRTRPACRRPRPPCRPPAPCPPGPGRCATLPSGDTIVTAGCTMPLHGSGPP